MAYLIDTQILIWSIANPSKLSNQTKNILGNNDILVSQVSFFEIVIKQRIGKLIEIQLTIPELIAEIRQDGYRVLSIQNAHISAYNQIPFFDNHKDPFDRLILATALSENLPVISADENFRLYVPQIRLIEN